MSAPPLPRQHQPRHHQPDRHRQQPRARLAALVEPEPPVDLGFTSQSKTNSYAPTSEDAVAAGRDARTGPGSAEPVTEPLPALLPEDPAWSGHWTCPPTEEVPTPHRPPLHRPRNAVPSGREEPAAPEPVPNAAPTSMRVGRLVQRWLPETLRTPRMDPGRQGAVALSAVAALAAVLAAFGVWRDRPVVEPVPALPVVATAGVPSSAPPGAAQPAGGPPGELVVSVVGRVQRPGLVRLAAGARVADALAAAGGALPGTDLIPLNLARRLSDGEQVLVGIAPPPGQTADGGVVGPGGPAPGTGPTATGSAAGGKINLNTATMEQLDTLPGVGPVTAQKIIDWRSANGRFSSVEQLREVSGIGEARFAQLRDRVTV